MKAVLIRAELSIYWIDVDGEKHDGAPSGIRGDLSDITGDLSDITGNLSGIRGNLTGIRGDLDKADITMEERAAGIDISALIKH